MSATLIASLLGGRSYDLGNLCAQGDPGDPHPTDDDWANAVRFDDPTVFIPARGIIVRWFIHNMWPKWCDCSDGTAPPGNTTTLPPSGSDNPGLPPAPVGGNCWDHPVTSTPISNGWETSYMQTFPQIASGIALTPTPQRIQSPLPAGYQVRITNNGEGSSVLGASGNLNVFDSTGTPIPAGATTWSSVHPGTPLLTPFKALPTNAFAWNMAEYTDIGGGAVPTNTVTTEVIIYCPGQSPINIVSPCCPPDPSVDARLAALMDMVTQLLSLQALQGPYQDAAVHAGLTGQGTIRINPASSAIRFNVTSDLTSWPHVPQTPNYYWSMGFVTPIAVGTPLKGQRLVYQGQTFTWPSYTDQIAYSFAAGITATLTELTRGA